MTDILLDIGVAAFVLILLGGSLYEIRQLDRKRMARINAERIRQSHANRHGTSP